MYAPEADPQPLNRQLHLVDLQYEEVSNSRTAVLNRESVRMNGEGWNVQSAGDHLVATRREGGRSQFERTLIATGGFLAVAYGATQLLASTVESLPISEGVLIGGAAALGALLALFTRDRAARDRRVTVSVDGQGRPFLVEQARDF